MEALYSPTTQSFALIPRSNSISSSSSSSIRLSQSKIQSIRSEFLGCGDKLRLRSRRKCKNLRFHTARVSSLKLVASLESLPIVVVVVAVTVSAIVVYSSFFFSNKKKDSNEAPGPTGSRYNQEGRDTSKEGFRGPDYGDHRHSENLKEGNYLLQEVEESLPEDHDGRVKLSNLVPSSIPANANTSNVEQAELHDSKINNLGDFASALSKRSEEIDTVQPLGVYTEKPESINRGQESVLNPVSTAPVVEMKDAVSVLVDFASVKEHDHAELNHQQDESQLQETDFDHLSPSPKVEMKDAMSVLVDAAPVKDQNFGESSHEHDGSQFQETDLSHLSPSPMVETINAVSTLVDTAEEKDEVSNHEHDDCQLQETELNLQSHAPVVEMKEAVSVAVQTVPVKDNYHDEAGHEHDECQLQAALYSENTWSGREELYVFYEDKSASDDPEVVHAQSALSFKPSLLENNDVPISTRISTPKMLLVDHSPAEGNGGHVSIASHVGGSFNEREGRPRSDTRDSSFQFGDQKSHDVPDTYKIQINGNHNISSHMNSYHRLLKGGRINECIELLEDMNRKDLLDMSKIYHAKFFNICRSQKAVKQAFRFAKLISNPTLSTFNMLMSVCSSAQDSEGAFEVCRLVQAAGFKADCKLYTTLISTCAKSGKVDTMFEVFHEMVNSGIEPNLHTYGALIDGCARAGQVAKAFGAYGILRSKNVKPDSAVFNALITACGQSGAVERAFDVLAEMRAEAHPIDPDHITIGALIRACTRAGQVDRVRGVYEMIDKYKIKGTPELYTIAINSCGQAGDWELACNIYEDMKKKGVAPDEMLFSALIDVAGHAGNLDDAFEVLQDARARGINPGIISYSSLMGACSKTQNWEKALELFEQIKALKLTPTVSTVNALLTALCDGHKMEKAMDVLSEMKQLGLNPNDVTYSILVVASEKNNDLEAGLTLFAQAKEDGVPLSLKMCKCLVRMCSRRYEKASTVGEPVLSFTSGRPQIDSKWTSLALRIYREIIGNGLTPSTEVLSQVLGCLQLPQDVSLKKKLTENLGINTDTSRKANLFPLIDSFGEYDPRAFSLFEEAASLGIVPSVSFKENPISIDARSLNVHIAEVYILTVLKGLKNRLAAGAKLSSITISLPVETTEISHPKGEKTVNISGRVSQAVGALLRRLRLPYQGNESQGKIKISGLAVKRWFQPKIVPSFSGKEGQMGLSQSTFAKGIANQQRNIRSGNLSLD